MSVTRVQFTLWSLLKTPRLTPEWTYATRGHYSACSEVRLNWRRGRKRCVSFRGQDYPSPLRFILLSSALFSVLEWPEICTNVLCSRSIHCESHLTFWLWAGASDKGSVFICTQFGTRDTYGCGQAKQTRRAIRKRCMIYDINLTDSVRFGLQE